MMQRKNAARWATAFTALIVWLAWPRPRTLSLCELYPDPGNIVIAIKTGVTEDRKGLEASLRTSLSCAKDVMILSDQAGEIGGRRTYDVLSYFDLAAMRDNPDFDFYRAIRSLNGSHDEQSLIELKTFRPADADSALPGKGAGWVLDKFKYLHVADAAWDIRPGKDWYLFLEADTYISWPTFLRWLSTLDPRARTFYGNAVPKDGPAQIFAQGGSGLLLPGIVVEQLASQNLTRSWDKRAHLWKFGDFLFADVLFEELGLLVENAHPAFNEHNETSLPLTPETWCEPVVTLHRVHSDSFESIFASEQDQQFERFVRSDVYRAGFGDGFRFPSERHDWDNMAEAKEHRIPTPGNLDAHTDRANCQAACMLTAHCMQSLFRNTTLKSSETMHECVLSKAFRLGHPKASQEFDSSDGEPDVFRAWTSGWHTKRIEEWVAAHKDAC